MTSEPPHITLQCWRRPVALPAGTRKSSRARGSRAISGSIVSSIPKGAQPKVCATRAADSVSPTGQWSGCGPLATRRRRPLKLVSVTLGSVPA